MVALCTSNLPSEKARVAVAAAAFLPFDPQLCVSFPSGIQRNFSHPLLTTPSIAAIKVAGTYHSFPRVAINNIGGPRKNLAWRIAIFNALSLGRRWLINS